MGASTPRFKLFGSKTELGQLQGHLLLFFHLNCLHRRRQLEPFDRIVENDPEKSERGLVSRLGIASSCTIKITISERNIIQNHKVTMKASRNSLFTGI